MSAPYDAGECVSCNRLSAEMAKLRTERDELAAQVEVMRHVANEWADAACNGLTWLRNVADGLSSTSEAISAMESDIKHARYVGASAGLKTAAAILRQRDARTLREAAEICTGLFDGQVGVVHVVSVRCAVALKTKAAELERKNG